MELMLSWDAISERILGISRAWVPAPSGRSPRSDQVAEDPLELFIVDDGVLPGLLGGLGLVPV